jgi:hypothetical protein
MRKYKKMSKLINNTGYTPGAASESNPINYIPSEDITMRDTPYPLYGQPLDQFGNAIAPPTYMEPGQEYKFGGASYVAEVPVYKDGGQKSAWISDKIAVLMGEGRPQKQAIAIAYSMWEQKHEMGGTQLPMMQDGNEYFSNNQVGFVEGFGNPGYQAPQKQPTFNFTPKQFPTSIDFNTKVDSSKYGLGQSPNYVNPLSTESLTAGKDWAAKNPLPAGVKQPMATSIGFEPMSATELSKGVQNAQVTDDGGAAARKTATTGITQFYNPYGDVGMGDALAFSGEQFAKGNTGLGIVGAASGVLQGAKAFLSGMGAQKRQNQVMKTYAEEQRKGMTGEGREVAMEYGGYYQNGGMDKSNYEEEINAEMDNSYPEVAAQNNPVFANQNTEAPVVAEEKASSNFDANSARDNWVQKTGLPWSEAKRLGYTDGTAKDNIKLLSELKDPRFKAENLRKAPVTRKAVNTTKQEVTVDKTAPKAPAVVNKKKSNYVDPYKGMYEDEEGDIRNAKGVMVGLDGQPLNWFERNFSDQGVIPPMDKNGRRMAKPGYGASTEDWNAWHNARYENKKAQEAQELRAAQLKRKQIEDTWGTPKYGQFQLFQEGGVQSPMEEGQEGAMSNPQEEQGEVPQQAGGDQMQAIAQEVAGMLQQGADPQEVLQQLVQAGIPEDQAMQIIQMVMEQMQGSQPQATPQLGRGGEMMKRADGSYSKRGLWDNIRDNAGSGRKPTKEMLDQEAKIKANKKEMGGYMYAEGGINNPGFKALPEHVQDKIMSNMYQEGGSQEAGSMEEVMSQVGEMLNQGADPQEVLQMLVDSGIPEQEAIQIIEAVMQQSEQAPQMRDGGIPQRYKTMGFNKVGAKKQSTRPGKKWMVLAKKGDQYKVVHGGDDSMKDFSQHGSEDRKENFWNRMGGRDSAKANDPFSPLYWHKKFGTWQEGGEMMDEQVEGENEGAEGETPNQEGIESQVEQALKQGADPQEILQQLVQMGMPEQEAIQMIQEIMQEIQNGETGQEAPEQEQPMMKDGGEYLEALKGKKIKNYTYNKNTGNYDVEIE